MKRKYTRRVKPELSPDNTGLKSERLKDSDRGIIPPSYQEAIKRDIKFRKRAGLPDDSKGRWERAIRYWRRK